MQNSEDNKHSSGKDTARDDRLGFMKKTSEERHLRDFQDQVKQNCIEYYHDLGKCAKENGLMVIVNCRDETKALNTCIDKNFSDELFRKYLADRGLPPPKPQKSFYDDIQKIFYSK